MDDAPSDRARSLTSRCGAYELIREINRGGTGSVWEGRHTTLGRRVAVKLLRSECASNPELAARFVREGEAAARINHPNVARMLDVGHDQEHLWLVMEYLEGEDLDTMLQREAPVAPERAVDLMLPVLSAVLSAHRVGVVHRDLKPGNVFLARDREGVVTPKVVDFGFSKIHIEERADDNLTRPETSLGTLSYMPMEQLTRAHEALPASDQYALAVTLYRCVTGRLPFMGKTQYDTYRALTAGVFPPPQELCPTLPSGLSEVILRAMERNPEARYSSVRDLAIALIPFATPGTQHRWMRIFDRTTQSQRASAPPERVTTPPARASTPPPRLSSTPLARLPVAAPARASERTLTPPSIPLSPARTTAPPPEVHSYNMRHVNALAFGVVVLAVIVTTLALRQLSW